MAKKSEKPMPALAQETASRLYPHTVKTMLDSKTLKELRHAAIEEERSIVEILRTLAQEWLAERKKQK